MIKKVIGQIHLWLGLTSGLVVFIVSITGCIYVYEEELKAWAYHDRETITLSEHIKRKPLSELLVVAQQEAGEEHPIQSMEISRAADQTYMFRPAQIRNTKAFTHFGEIVYQRKIYVDPYNGDVVMNENTKYEFFTLVLRLHRNLLLNRKTGSLIVGTSVLIFVIMLITGIVLWWPKNMRALKKSFSLSWKSTTRWKRKNYDLHNVFGFYASFILLVIAVTGLVWAFDWFDQSLQWVANRGKTYAKSVPMLSDTTQRIYKTPIDNIYAEILRRNPDAHTITISLPEKKDGVVTASARSGIHIRYTSLRYQFDKYTGALLNVSDFEGKNRGEKLRAMNYDIHVGGILGAPGKLLAFCASLISASLPITGFLIWYGRRNKKLIEQKTRTISTNSRSPIRQHASPKSLVK